jgi:putative transposase
MTDDSIALRALLEKSADADLLREMIGFAAERLMELEVQGLTGAGYGERTAERLAQRNGYRDRVWETRAAPSNCVSPSSGGAAISPASWSHAGSRRRR